jgi:hypothetical protein
MTATPATPRFAVNKIHSDTYGPDWIAEVEQKCFDLLQTADLTPYPLDHEELNNVDDEDRPYWAWKLAAEDYLIARLSRDEVIIMHNNLNIEPQL